MRTGALQFRLLGPLEAWRDGRPLRLGGERQRVLLALLVTHANELVTTDRLLEHFFGAGLSDGGVNAVHAAVSRLRRVLGHGAGDVVVATRPGGYVLRADPEQVDALMFERLLADGQRLLSTDEGEGAAARLGEALALWRGPALADLAFSKFLQEEIRRLEELRLLATMERVDAELRLGRGASVIPDLERLVAANSLQERLRGQLMRALYGAGRQADALEVYRRTSELLRDELGLEPSPGLQELQRQVLRQDPALEREQGPTAGRLAIAPMPAVCPFRGLAPFDRSDAEFFCGRERLISDLLARLAESTLVGIVGPSGIGKSSLLRAGLLARFSEGALPGSASWRQILMRPGEHPCAELRRALGPGVFRELLARPTPSGRIVVAVDQLEELFTVCHQDADRAAFLEQLADAASDSERRVLIVVSLRADFYGRFAAYVGFARLLSSSHLLVGPMQPDELAEAIELPAVRAGLEVERRLVQRLVDDVAGEPGGLPLLSTTLLELWRVRDGRVLRSGSYMEGGGVRGAVARLAEAAYLRLDEGERRAARVVLLRLASGKESALVRRRVAISDFERIPGADRVLAALTDARLLTISDGDVEVSHEALLQEWPRYHTWLEEDHAGRQVQARLEESAGAWDAGGRDPGDLYRGARLAAALEWSAHKRDELSPREEDFLQASRKAAERATRRLRAVLAGVALLLVISLIAGVIALIQKQHATTEARQALAQQLGAEAVINPRIDLAMLLAREATNLDRSYQTESTLLATLLRSPTAIASFELPLGVRPLSLTLSPHGSPLLVGANNNHLYFYDPVRRRQERPPMGDFNADPWPIYSTDGSLLLLADDGNPPAIDVFRARTLRRLVRLRFDHRWLSTPTTDSFTESLAVSPDRRSVYYGYAPVTPSGAPGPGYLDRWALPSGRLLSSTRVSPSGLLAIRLVDDGRRVVALGDRTATILAAPTLKSQKTAAVHLPTGPPLAVAINPTGTSAAYGTSGGFVKFVNLATGAVKAGVGGHTSAVQTLKYSPDGRLLVSTADDNRVVVWNPQSAQAEQILTGHAGRPTGIAFSADSHTLYTSSLDGTVLTWDLGGNHRFGRPFTVGPGLPPLPSQTAPLTPPLAVSPDGSQFATRTRPGRVGVFSTDTLRQQFSFAIPRVGVVSALAWSPDGRTLAVGGYGGLVQQWDLSGPPRPLRSLTGLRPPKGTQEAVQSVAFSSDGRLLAASDLSEGSGGAPPGGRLAIWRTATGAPEIAPRALGASGNEVAFSRDGQRLAVALGDGRVLISNSAEKKRTRTLHPLDGANGGTVSVAFAPDGRLATGTWAGLLQLWNPSTGVPLRHPLLVGAAPLASISFDSAGDRFATTGGPEGGLKLWFTSTLQQEGTTLDPEQATWGNAVFTQNGRSLLSINADGKGSLWPAALGAWERHACAVAGRNFTHEEWSRFVSRYSYQRVCP